MTKVYISNSEPLLDPSIYKRAYLLLSPKNKEKVDRYQKEDAKRNCIVASLLLRHAFNEEGINPKDEDFDYGEHGKPFLKNGLVHFNLSHTKDGTVVVAVSSNEVGVDVEVAEGHKLDIAKRYFTKKENDVIARSSNQERTFARLWTLKECYLKLKGTGLSESLSSYDFSSFVYCDCFDAFNAHFEALDFGDCLVSVAMDGELAFVSSVDIESLIYDR